LVFLGFRSTFEGKDGASSSENLTRGHLTWGFWEQIGPIIEPWRKAWNYPRLASETEYLGKSLLKYMDEHPELKT